VFLFKKKGTTSKKRLLTEIDSHYFSLLPPSSIFILKDPSLCLSSCCRNTNPTSTVSGGAYSKAAGEAA